MLQVGTKYSMRDLIRDFSYCAWAAKLRCGSNKCKWRQRFLLHQFALASYETNSYRRFLGWKLM